MLKIATAAVLLTLTVTDVLAQGRNRVDGYMRRDGTYVQPHYRTNPDNSRLNNWSSQGNYNPHTGRQGTVNPYEYQAPRQGSGMNNLNNPYRRR